jgi:hypothetical protein
VFSLCRRIYLHLTVGREYQCGGGGGEKMKKQAIWTRFIHGLRHDMRFLMPSALSDMIEMCNSNVHRKKGLSHSFV